MTELKPAADEEPCPYRDQCTPGYDCLCEDERRDEAAHQRWLARHPVTPLRVRVDTGPVGCLWLEWLGACARVAGISEDAPESTWTSGDRWLHVDPEGGTATLSGPPRA